MRPLPRDVRDVLACPVCHGQLSDVANTRSGDASARLVGLACASCDVVYPISDGIPQLLPDAAQTAESKPG